MSDMTGAALYERLKVDRQPYERRAEAAATLTLPHLYHASDRGPLHFETLEDPWQSIGARGVNNLASKLQLALFPPQQPFFRLAVDDFLLEEIAQVDGAQQEVMANLVRQEEAIRQEFEHRGFRPRLSRATKLLVVTGNCLLHVPAGKRPRVFDLNRYVIRRDPMGDVQTIVVRESVDRAALRERGVEAAPEGRSDRSTFVNLFTVIEKDRTDEDFYTIHQEGPKGERVPGTDSRVRQEELEWIPLRWEILDGEDYGRGHVEGAMGDLQALEVLSEAIVQASAAAAKVIYMVRPGSSANIQDLNDAENGDFVSGQEEDVGSLNLDKFADLRVAQASVEALVLGLETFFLVRRQRDAERVTALEVQVTIQELQEALGGTFAALAEEVQLPVLAVLRAQMTAQGRLPDLGRDDIVRPQITTGVDAIGRGQDLQRLQVALQTIAQLGPQALGLMKPQELVKRILNGAGVTTKDLLKTPEELQQEAQQAQLRQIGQNPELVKQIGGFARENIERAVGSGEGAQTPNPDEA